MSSIKDDLIGQLALSMELSEDIISKIVSFQGEDALKAVKLHDEIEFSGFGKFYLSQTKLKKRLSAYERAIEKRKQLPEPDLKKISDLEKYSEELKSRIK